MANYLGFRPSDNPKYYFLSYNTEDADRVGEIAGQMSQAGIELWYDKGIEYGEKWERTIAEKIYGCQAVVLFFTRGILYKENSYVEKEYKMALKFSKKIYVVMMDEIDDEDVPPVRMPWWTDIQDLQCIEAPIFANSDVVVEEIVSVLTVKREPDTGDVRSESANIELRSTYDANIPASAWTHTVLEHNLVKYLTAYIPIEPKVGLIGRDDVVNKVRTMLDSHKNIALVSGIGGIGKTAVMAQICNDIITEDRKDTYVAWITCGESYIDDFLGLRQALGIPEGLECEDAYKEVIGKLRKLNGTLYLFLDDMGRMPDRKELGMYNTLRPNVRIMITSRHEIKGIPHVDLQELKKDSAIKMFYDYYGRDKEQKYVSDAWWIIKSDSVRSHTQLVELLAKAANVFYGRLPEFRRKLEEKGYLDVSHRRFDSGRFANNTIKEIVIQLYNVSDLSEEQQRIMRLFSIFTAEKVIYGAVEEWAGFDEDTVDGLAKLGWLVRAENGFIIRQIIKDSLVEQVGENLKIEDYGDLLNRVIDTNEYMPRDLEYSEVQERLVLTVDVARYLWTRVEGFLENENHSEEYKELFMSSGVLFNNIAGVFRAQVDYEKALEYYGKALAISERVLGTEHPDTATTYNDTGRVYYCQDDYARALEYYMKALSIRERVLGSDHPDTATTYNNMALVYDAQGDYEMALEYYVKALSIREQVLGVEHPDTAMTYNNMVSLLRVQVDYEKALVIVEKVLDPEWPSTVMTYSKMAGVYENMGHYPKALACYAKALSISERVLGPEHPSTATAYNNMAVVYYKRGDFKNSLKYFEKALAVRKMKLGINHPNTQNTMKWIDKAKTEVHTISEMYKYRG